MDFNAPLVGPRPLDRVMLISPEGKRGRDTVALGLLNLLAGRYKRPTIFRPFVDEGEQVTDGELTLLRSLEKAAGSNQSREQHIGVSSVQGRFHTEDARLDVVTRFHESTEIQSADFTLIVGSDGSQVVNPDKLNNNALVAADLQTPVFLVVCTRERTGEELRQTVEALTNSVKSKGSEVIGVFVSPCPAEKLAQSQAALKDSPVPVWFVPPVADEGVAAEELTANRVAAFAQAVPTAEVIAVLDQPYTPVVTPYCFQYSLLGRAKADKKTVVLPEGNDDRILKAADYLLSRDIVNLIIVGEQAEILARGQELGLGSLGQARFIALNDEEQLAPMIEELVKLRAHKGMTPEAARTTLTDPSYFGTMLIQLGLADGMVSGACHSTANTVRPALQIIKTLPGNSLVSGAFLMCQDTRVDVFADCAINLNPSSEQLAEIAAQSARTAEAFGIKPVIGMLSYSTLGSGKGPDVDLVEGAVSLAQEKYPELKLVGPIQFDAAWSPTVAATKAKGNEYAGHVNTFIFPSLSAGNIAYKAVQRSAGALAVGPVLQGLRKPVNDLSRGALVQDIINTVALTAITAQGL